MNKNTRKTATEGETLACGYLRENGYEIICRNYSCPAGEIDIIAKEGGYTVFVEVKSRTGTSFGMPAESVDYRKRRKIITAAKFWISAHGAYCADYRFDVVSVLRDKPELIKNAFDLSGV